MHAKIFAVLLSLLAPPFMAADAAPARRASSRSAEKIAGGVPFILDSQRVLVDVAFETPDGGARKALVWFNMGMAAPMLTKTLYRELAIEAGQPLRIKIGERVIEAPAGDVVNGDGGVGVPDFGHLFAPRRVEAMLPASLLRRYVVTLDYGRHVFALAEQGAQRPRGVATPCLVNPDTGVVAVEASIDGETYPLAIDAGAGYSWMRGDVAKRLLAHHPDWRRAEGAVGQANANMVDYAFEKNGTVLRIPQIAIGAQGLEKVGFLGTAPVLGAFGDGLFGDLFWDNWHKAAPAPVVGWIGGNVLKDYSVTIDYPNRTLYWRRQRGPDLHELDQAPLTLVRHDGRFFIGGLARDANGATSAEGVEIGDELVAVDGAVVRGGGKDGILSALHGAPGARRRLTLERGGVRLEADVAVANFE